MLTGRLQVCHGLVDEVRLFVNVHVGDSVKPVFRVRVARRRNIGVVHVLHSQRGVLGHRAIGYSLPWVFWTRRATAHRRLRRRNVRRLDHWVDGRSRHAGTRVTHRFRRLLGRCKEEPGFRSLECRVVSYLGGIARSFFEKLLISPNNTVQS